MDELSETDSSHLEAQIRLGSCCSIRCTGMFYLPVQVQCDTQAWYKTITATGYGSCDILQPLGRRLSFVKVPVAFSADGFWFIQLPFPSWKYKMGTV